MAYFGACIMLFMVVLTVLDVIGRYFFSSPINGTWEVVGLMLVCAGTWCLPYCQQERRHVNVTILQGRLSKPLAAGIEGFSYLIGIAGFSLLTWEALQLTVKYFSQTGYVTDTLHIPLYPFVLIMAVGNGILALVLCVDLFKTLPTIVRK
jgi:TRAP-type C4-dicarboxylate transport system permease small subunit